MAACWPLTKPCDAGRRHWQCSVCEMACAVALPVRTLVQAGTNTIQRIEMAPADQVSSQRGSMATSDGLTVCTAVCWRDHYQASIPMGTWHREGVSQG